MISFKTLLLYKSLQGLMTDRGIEAGGKVQQFIDSEVLRKSDPYVPFLTGTLKSSGIRETTIGSGYVKYKTPYARKQYFENKGNGKRGKMWFERMKADHQEDILRGAIKLAGGVSR
ncbi:MAG: minor capsid protein [Youngiibacter sp.]|nr:minor capsid protein [Youngiibacter sp.]